MPQTPTRILLVEDNPGDARLIRELLYEAGGENFTIEQADRLAPALARLERGGIDLVLLDLGLPDADGIDTFVKARTRIPNTPIVVLTGHNDQTTALAAVQAGAQDYLVKGAIDTVLLTRSIRYAIERQRLLFQLQDLLRRERENAAELAALDEIKSVFMAAVAHDLRTPLTAIQLSAGTLARQLDRATPGELSDRVAHVLKAADEIHRLLATLLDLERFSNGHGQALREPTPLPALVEQILAQLELSDHAVETQIAPLSASVDPVLVERIIQNLLLNAAYHTPAGTRIWLRITAHDTDGLLIAVDDEGGGITDESKQLIFEPFRRGSSNVSRKGSGVGLYLVARFSQLHEGRCWVEDRPGGGASFRVQLPAELAPAPQTGRPSSKQRLGTKARAVRSET